uniref:Uncharacterized protein n=1 Tax=Ixodes ricinus TaxID=34613 RepID=A0A6B0UTU9_IXORI
MAWQTTGRWMGATGLAALPSRGGGTSCRKWPRNRSSALSTASGLTWWYGWVSTTSPLASKVVVSEPRRPLTTNPRFASRNHRSWFVDVPTQYAMTPLAHGSSTPAGRTPMPMFCRRTSSSLGQGVTNLLGHWPSATAWLS